MVRDYADCNSLDQTGRVLFHLNRIPGVAERLELHEICFSWLSAASETASQIRVVQHACDELNASQSLMKRLLAMYNLFRVYWPRLCIHFEFMYALTLEYWLLGIISMVELLAVRYQSHQCDFSTDL